MIPTALAHAVLALTLTWEANAHIAMWNKGLFGYNWPDPANATQNYASNKVVAPLRQNANNTVDVWFAHGMKNLPPKDGDFMELEAGSNYTAELSCNRAWTTMRNPSTTGDLPEYACTNNNPGPLHTANKFGQTPDLSLFGGSGISIAYTSDVDTVKPTDFTMISINYTSVWMRETIYEIPEGLPTCGDGGCLCTWGWYHGDQHKEGYGSEMYHTLYRCQISGKTNNKNKLALGSGTVPTLCESDASQCVKGPKQPMYVYQTTGNNMANPTYPPTYNQRYGFTDGAQTDLFEGSGSTSDAAKSLATTGAQMVLALAVAPQFMRNYRG